MLQIEYCAVPVVSLSLRCELTSKKSEVDLILRRTIMLFLRKVVWLLSMAETLKEMQFEYERPKFSETLLEQSETAAPLVYVDKNLQLYNSGYAIFHGLVDA